MKEATEKRTFRVGQKISFLHGYNLDIRSEFKITEIEGENIYIDWDCHWSPIQDTPARKIKVIE